MNTSSFSKSPLVYDISASGHRLRDATIIAEIVGGTVLLAPVRASLWRLIWHPAALIWQTADYELSWFSLVLILRALTCRRTVGICYRNNNVADGKRLLHLARKILFALWNLLPFSAAFTTCAPTSQHQRRTFLYDTEWWDLLFSPLAEATPPRIEGGGKILMYIGSISDLKGVGFFIDAAIAAAERALAWRFVLVGSIDELTLEEKEKIRKSNIICFVGPEEDTTFVSYIKQADVLWCCYNPIYDQSSGIFGRSLQLNKPTLTRKGSLLNEWQTAYGSGLAVGYQDIDELLDGLTQPVPTRSEPYPCTRFLQEAKERLVAACG